MVAFAMLWRRKPTSPYIVLDCFTHPDEVGTELNFQILKWGDQRAQAIAANQKKSITVFANGFSQLRSDHARLRAMGYFPLQRNPDEHNVYFYRSLLIEFPARTLKAGYTIQHLTNIDDLEAYRTLYSFADVNPKHQLELIESNEYFHLVLVNPNGEFVAYCECSISRDEWQDSHKQIGWIDYIETKPEYQNKGFGLFVLTSALEFLKIQGAESAMLVTVSTNHSAQRFFKAAGFEPIEIIEPIKYRKKITIVNSKIDNH
jgi:ribosomal protein S18 acetylase RimI-like enzyme